ncbi:MAG: hypothetical protein NTW19_05765 [Planctomycetota bacterium]|nr:hypothetical protein [Planctomycetota bacterium]
MAHGQDYSKNQKKIINRYYDNRDTIMTQKLGELVSEIFLCEDDKKADKLWASAATALKNTQANPVRVAKLVADRNVKELAQVISELAVPGRAAPPPPAMSVNRAMQNQNATPSMTQRETPKMTSSTPAPGSPAPGNPAPGVPTPGNPATPAAAPAAGTPAAGEILPDTLKAALKAFKKRLKLTQLEEDSKLGYGPVGSRKSTVTAVMPPNQFPRAVWTELVRLGKLKSAGQGCYELLEP